MDTQDNNNIKYKIQLYGRSYPREESCGIGTDMVEIQLAIDLVVEYDGLWLACGGGKS